MGKDFDVDDVVVEPEGEHGEGTSAQKMKKLREERDHAKKERDEYLAGWQRSKADYVNLSRRAREAGEAAERALLASIAESLAPVFDSLDAALTSAEEAHEGTRKGIAQVIGQLEAALKQNGITRFTPKVGDEFNPTLHEPMQTVATEREKEDNTVGAVFQSGYKAHEQVVRPARISVKRYNKS